MGDYIVAMALMWLYVYGSMKFGFERGRRSAMGIHDGEPSSYAQWLRIDQDVWYLLGGSLVMVVLFGWPLWMMAGN